ncbi:MAG: hypothetical protein LBV72_18630 [Tannerella sp.]|nr:hypothetical protein [Tannerella sp.]
MVTEVLDEKRRGCVKSPHRHCEKALADEAIQPTSYIHWIASPTVRNNGTISDFRHTLFKQRLMAFLS